MKELYTALTGFVRKDWDWTVYGLTMLFLAGSIFINYSPTIDISPVQLTGGTQPRLIYYSLLFGGTYFLTALIAQYKTKTEFLTDWRFWAFGIWVVFIAMTPKLYFFKFIEVKNFDWTVPEKHFVSKCHFFVNQLGLALIGLGIAKVVFGKWIKMDFGFSGGWKKLKPYFLVLLLVSPLIIGASFFPDFQKAYPQYKPWRFKEIFDLAVWQRAAIFEFSYATGFVAVESLFRGALAITMVKIMGPRAVLAMASFYCVFHFGKPMGEAVAAFFGGYALGVLAIHSNSILGGLIVHLGVAMLMETLAYLHFYAS